MKINLTKRETDIIRNALENETDDNGLTLKSWKIDSNNTLKEVYGKKRWEEIIRADEKYLKDAYKLAHRFWLFFKRQESERKAKK
jgi:hypothetical protein